MKNFLTLFLIFTSINLSGIELKLFIKDADIDIPLEGVRVVNQNNEDVFYSDADGIISFEVEQDDRVILSLNLIGYQSRKIKIDEFDITHTITMSIEGVLEGEELVIEEAAIGKSDEEVGVSMNVDKEQLKSTAMSGPIEDVMSAVKMLPGVSYTGQFSTDISVRGGDPGGLTTVLDNFVVRFPWHWGGAFSVFNPNTIENTKFSNGIFSVKHGLATDGLIEMDTITPNDGFHLDLILSTLTLEVLLQTQIGNLNSGLFIGGRLTQMDLTFLIGDAINLMAQVEDDGMTFHLKPYIRDAYFRWFYKPDDRVELYVNSFFASDGIGVQFAPVDANEDETVLNTFQFNWSNYDFFLSTGVKLLPTDNIFIHLLTGYEFFYYLVDGSLKEYGSLSNNLGKVDFNSHWTSGDTMHSIQARADVDITLHEKVMLSTGLGSIIDFNDYDTSGSMYSIVYDGSSMFPEYKKRDFEVDAEANQIFNFFVYLNFTFFIIPETFKIETGIRVDQNLILTKNDRVLTYPVPGPRLNITYTPFKNKNWLEEMTLSAGVGLFSKMPIDAVSISEDFDIKDFELSVPKNLLTVTGVEFRFLQGIKFKIEGYYKFLFDRFYVNTTNDDDGKMDYLIHTDGIGHAGGFDLMLERKFTRFVDGWISYSFVYVKLFNPETDGMTKEQFSSNAPRDNWYFPDYHRFHNLNIVLNIRPFSWMTITAKWTFASGSPKPEYGEKVAFPVNVDGNVIMMYNRKAYYNDDLRSDFSAPFSVKLAFQGYFTSRKVMVESYISAEDIFAPIYAPEGGIQIDKYTGEEQPAPEQNFNFGIPMISVGVKISY